MKFAVILLVSVIATVSASYEEKDFATYTFAHTFAKILRADPNDVKIFDIALIPEKEAGPVYQKALTEFLQDLGDKDAEELGRKLGDSVGHNLHKVTPKEKAIIVGYNLASQFKATGHLTDYNAEEQAKVAAAEMDEAIRKTDITTPGGKIKAFLVGYQAIFKHIGLNFVDIVKQLVDNASKILA